MNYKMICPLLSKLTCVQGDLSVVPISFIEIDLSQLVDDYDYIRKLLINFEPNDQLDYYVLLKISEWLFDCYKKINDPIMSNRILNEFRFTLNVANDIREYK